MCSCTCSCTRPIALCCVWRLACTTGDHRGAWQSPGAWERVQGQWSVPEREPRRVRGPGQAPAQALAWAQAQGVVWVRVRGWVLGLGLAQAQAWVRGQ